MHIFEIYYVLGSNCQDSKKTSIFRKGLASDEIINRLNDNRDDKFQENMK